MYRLIQGRGDGESEDGNPAGTAGLGRPLQGTLLPSSALTLLWRTAEPSASSSHGCVYPSKWFWVIKSLTAIRQLSEQVALKITNLCKSLSETISPIAQMSIFSISSIWSPLFSFLGVCPTWGARTSVPSVCYGKGVMYIGTPGWPGMKSYSTKL